MKWIAWIIRGGVAFVAINVIMAVPAGADIYRHVDENGVIHFTNVPTSGRYSFYMKEESDRSTVREIIDHYAAMYRMEDALVKAVIKVESDYDSRAVSSRGAQGLMQLIPETARDMQVANPFNPEDNIRGGTRYLRLMLDQFNNNLDLALAAYNAGPGTVRRHGGVPPYRETRNYIDRVKKYLQYYRRNEDTRL